jgi:uncharacterized protein YkwD
MRLQRFLSLAVFVCLALITSHAQEFASRAERELFSACNRERQAQGLPTLRWNPSLAEAARRHAQLMVTNQTISHQFAGEPSLATRASRAGVSWMALAENVAEAPSPEEIHNLWMHSPGHRANILDGKLDSIGIAVLERGGEYYAVEDFSKAKTTAATLTH